MMLNIKQKGGGQYKNSSSPASISSACQSLSCTLLPSTTLLHLGKVLIQIPLLKCLNTIWCICCAEFGAVSWSVQCLPARLGLQLLLKSANQQYSIPFNSDLAGKMCIFSTIWWVTDQSCITQEGESWKTLVWVSQWPQTLGISWWNSLLDSCLWHGATVVKMRQGEQIYLITPIENE